MTYRIALPAGGRCDTLDLIEPNSTAVQRFLRRHGLAGYEPSTLATVGALLDGRGEQQVVFDIGANIGLYSMFCSAVFDAGVVHAFEPAPSTAAVAERLIDANGLSGTVQLYRAAASSVKGTAELHLSDSTDVSHSLLGGFKASSASVIVDTITIDDHVAATGVVPTLLKIDVEGHEAAALIGARRTIESHRPTMIVEVLDRRNGTLARDIDAALTGLDYSCYRLGPTPSWDRRATVAGTSGHADWLLTPEPIGPDFDDRWRIWADRLAACGPDRNSRVPLVRTALVALRRGGVRDAVAGARRFSAELVGARRRSQSPTD